MHWYFWEVDPQKIDFDKHDQYVVERVLDWGNTQDINWTLKNFGKDKIAAVVKKRRGLSKRTAVFWATVLGISYQEVACLQKPFLEKH